MILVTGATGLVGQHLIKRLSNSGFPVRALYHHAKPVLELPFVQWMQGDILSLNFLEKAFEGIDIVYHCAAIVSYNPLHYEQLMEINVEGTARIVNMGLTTSVKKLIYVSSTAAIGYDTDSDLISENTSWNGSMRSSVYALSKHKAEMEVMRGIAEGLPAVIVNPGIILGEGNWNKSSTHLFKIVDEEFPYYTRGATAFVDVEDVVSSLLLLQESDISGERYIISAGNFPFLEVFTLMAEAMGKRPPYRYASPFLTQFVWRFAYLKSLLSGKTATITRETAAAAHRISRYNNQKFLHAFPGFQYRPLGESIQRIVRNGFQVSS